LVHSFIFNIRDKDWLDYFSESELKEIQEYNAVELPPVSEEVEEYLNELKGL